MKTQPIADRITDLRDWLRHPAYVRWDSQGALMILAEIETSHAALLEACKLARAFGSQGETHEGLSVSHILDRAVAKAESP